jgi:hypothetical protein
VPVARGAVRPASHEVRALNPSVPPIPSAASEVRSLNPSAPSAASSNAAPTPTEPEWSDGEEVYTIYRPSADDAESTA